MQSNLLFSSDSLSKGQVWRSVTSKLAFVDTRDAVFALMLIYHFRLGPKKKVKYVTSASIKFPLSSFRVFERRLGSRKFCSHLLASFLLSTAVEILLAAGSTAAAEQRITAVLAAGP